MIFNTITSTVGFAHVNMKVKDQLRDWYVPTLTALGADAEKASTSDAAMLMTHVGFVLRGLGLTEEALSLHKRSLVIYLATRGPNHHDTATCYNNIGGAYYTKSDFKKAIEYNEKCLAIRLATLGPNHPDTAGSYNNIGGAYDNMGEYDKAIEYHQKCLTIELATLGPDHPDTAGSFSTIGSA